MIYQLVEEAKLWLVEQHAAHAAGSLTLSTDVLGSKNSPAAHPPTPSPPSQPQSLPARITPPPGQVGKHTVVMQGEEDDLTPEEVQQLIEESTAEAARIAQERGAFVMADQGAWKYTVGMYKWTGHYKETGWRLGGDCKNSDCRSSLLAGCRADHSICIHRLGGQAFSR
jgi:hypothetical protein